MSVVQHQTSSPVFKGNQIMLCKNQKPKLILTFFSWKKPKPLSKFKNANKLFEVAFLLNKIICQRFSMFFCTQQLLL